MSWLDLIWAAAVAVLTLGAIGGSLAWAVGLKGYWAVAVAPAFALTLIGGTAIVAPWLGLSWSLVPVLILTALIAAALWFVRRITRRARSGEPSGRRPFDFWLLLGLAIAAIVLSLRVVDAIGAPANFSQTFDNIFHLNAVRFVLDTGNASSLNVGRMTNPGGALGFYPAAWHGAVALIVQLSGVAIPVAVNAMTLVVAALIWPLGVVLLTRTLFGAGRVLVVSAGILATAFPLFPMLLMDYGVLYPFQLALALTPVALAATAQALGLVPEGGGLQRWWWALVLVGTLPGIMLAHPGAFVSWLALSAPMAVAFAVQRWRASRTVRGRSLVIISFIAYMFAGALMLMALRPPSDARGWPTAMSIPSAVWEVLSVSAWYGIAATVAALAVFAGVVWAIVARTVPALVGLGMYLVAAFLFVTVAAMPFGALRDAFTGGWYNNIPRLAAMLPMVMVPLAAFGVARSASAIARIPVFTRARARLAPAWRVAVALLVVAGGILSVQGPAMAQASASVSHMFALTPDSVLVNTDEYALIQRLDEHVPEGVAVAGSPWTGASLSYALADRPVLMPHTLMEITDELALINERLDEASWNDAVCAAIDELGVGFVLDFGTQEVHGAIHEFPGFDNLAESDRVRLVDAEGAAKLYEIVACGAVSG
ncbi:MAG: hypothetical protein KDB08_00765 [Microthrixaceae bacterium]|nr:hypothetical protein [Microthrixaceae bacterium]